LTDLGILNQFLVIAILFTEFLELFPWLTNEWINNFFKD
jgi:hypothetical protein